jgi:hypothetical protein
MRTTVLTGKLGLPVGGGIFVDRRVQEVKGRGAAKGITVD